MEDNQSLTEQDLLTAAIGLLKDRLPSNWTVERVSFSGSSEPQDILLRAPGGSAQALVLVEARTTTVSPRDVHVLMGGPWRRWRKGAGNYPILLIAPYISPKVRELLTEEGVSYLDLSGNLRIRVEYPGLFIATTGASQGPTRSKTRRGLTGAKAGALVRALVDARPPYTGAEIAKVARVSGAYVSRILETLSDEGLIERERPGRVVQIDWVSLLRRRAREIDLFQATRTFRYVARAGPRRLMEDLAARPDREPSVITGSFAASRLAPVTVPKLLVIYVSRPRALAEELQLLPVEAGADTILIRPDSDVVFERVDTADGLSWAAPSQVAIDCLAGSGRMPSEGEAVIQWMRQNEPNWRRASIKELLRAPATDERDGA